MATSNLNYVHSVIFDHVPLAWTTRFEFFTPDLEQFPLMYVHKYIDVETRVYGFPVSASVSKIKGKECNIIVTFLCNHPPGNKKIDEIIVNELSHRFGLANMVSLADIPSICKGNQTYQHMLTDLWNGRIDKVYGGKIPHGRIYDEVFGIVRFSASGVAPRLGKTSELRMTYWFLKEIGEKVTIGGSAGDFGFCEFYLLPTMEELRARDFELFPKFGKLHEAMTAFWELEYHMEFKLYDPTQGPISEIKNELEKRGLDTRGKKAILIERLSSELSTKEWKDAPSFRCAPSKSSELPDSGKKFETRYEKMLPDHYNQINRLRQIFNRNPSRMYGFIWNMMTFIEHGFRDVFSDRNQFKDFLKYNHERKGSSSKVLACILQQCFGLEAIPIDTWVKTFIMYPMGFNPMDKGKSQVPLINSNIERLYSEISELDKLEKVIWVSSMGNKTNKTEFEDTLWCQRYGTDKLGKGPCRGANPLSCSQCNIRDHCSGFKSIMDLEIIVETDDQDLLKEKMIQGNYPFGIDTHDGTPREVFALEKNKAVTRDAHTGFEISTDVKIASTTYKVSEFISKIEP